MDASPINDAVVAANEWYNIYLYWAVAHYTMGILIVVGSVLVASSIDWLSQGARKLIALIVALISALYTFLAPAEQSRVYASATANLSAIINVYHLEENQIGESAIRLRNDIVVTYNTERARILGAILSQPPQSNTNHHAN